MHSRIKIQFLKTYDKLGIDCSLLDYNSHEKVYVQCSQCGEEFLREFKNISQPHNCPTHIIKDKLKLCGCCNKYIKYEQFPQDTTKYDGLNEFCINCNLLNKESRAKSWMDSEISRLQHNGDTLDIDQDYLLSCYYKQNGSCYYSKIPLEFEANLLRSAYLECLDDKLGYIKGNVVLVCQAMNWVRQPSPEVDLVKLIFEASNHFNPYIRLETKIVHEAGKLPFRKRTSDAGYDLYSCEDVVIHPNSVKRVNTGIIVCPPDGTYYTIEGRSSVFSAGVTPYRGIIDGTYQGNLFVMLMNNSCDEYVVKVGDRIAQLVLHKIINADFIVVDEFSPIANGRANDGWGSSGK